MADESIEVNGEEVPVREDTAKAYRGVIWALISIAVIALIALALFLGLFSSAVADDAEEKNPAEVEQSR